MMFFEAQLLSLFIIFYLGNKKLLSFFIRMFDYRTVFGILFFLKKEKGIPVHGLTPLSNLVKGVFIAGSRFIWWLYLRPSWFFEQILN